MNNLMLPLLCTEQIVTSETLKNMGVENIMTYLSIKLTDFILKKGVISENDYSIYQYGFQCFLEISTSTICSIIIALFLKMLPECILFFLFFIPLRSYSGGIHMQTYTACFLCSCGILISTLLMVKYLVVPLSASFPICILALIFMKIIGPVNHPNKEVSKEDDILFINRTNVILVACFIISVLFVIFDNPRFLFLETIVFIYLCITSMLGKIIYNIHK